MAFHHRLFCCRFVENSFDDQSCYDLGVISFTSFEISIFRLSKEEIVVIRNQSTDQFVIKGNLSYFVQLSKKIWMQIRFEKNGCRHCIHASFILLPPANEVCEGYVFTRVCHSVHGGVESASVHAGIPPPRDQVTPRADTPQSRHLQTSRSRHPSGAVHAGRYGQRAGGMHHTGMQSCCLCKQNKNVSFFGISFNKNLDHAILCKRLRNGSPSHFTCSVQLRVNGSPQRMRHGYLKRGHHDLY